MLLVVCAICSAAIPAQAGDFINLGFNDPDLSNAYYDVDRGLPGPPVRVAPVLDVLRGWSITPGPSELPYGGLIGIGEDFPPFGLELNAPEQVDRFGTYRLGMNPSATSFPDSPPRPGISILQSGTVPHDAATLLFFEFREFNVPIEVYLSGERQPVTTLDTSLTLKGVDVAAFAGTEVTLEFRFPAGNLYTFDILGFLPDPSPKPRLTAHGSGLGAQPDGFHLSVTGTTNAVAVLETSASLGVGSWVPLQTNTLVGGVTTFVDPGATNASARFYRVRAS